VPPTPLNLFFLFFRKNPATRSINLRGKNISR
jgi:hypothetical protein